MIAYKPFQLCPVTERPAGVPLALPWLAEDCQEEDAEALRAEGWTVLTTEEYDAYLETVEPLREAWEALRANYGRVPAPQPTPSFAVDKDNVDQAADGSAPTIITAQRVLWDIFQNFTLADSKFRPAANSIWNLNGTVTLRDVSADLAAIDVYRNDALWFTVASADASGISTIALPFSCDIDAYITSQHDFDLRLRLEPSTATATISGSDEETAWGMSLIATIEGESPT